MKKQKGFTLIELIIVVLVIFLIGGWVYNLVKLTSCDFEAPLKCELIHGVGVFIPPLSIATVWVGVDN